jgi:hypothetical protein
MCAGSIAGVLLACVLLGAAPVQAASISYFLDQSNGAADGVNYLQVTIADGTGGAIDFTVETLAPLNGAGRNNFGMQRFSFNADSGVAAGNIVGLPDNWRVQTDKNQSQFGRFDIRLLGTGNSRLDTLQFSIVGIEGDTIEDYVRGSAGGQDSFFAAHVPGPVSGAHFGGSTLVPLPAAAWLFFSALGVLGAARHLAQRWIGGAKGE